MSDLSNSVRSYYLGKFRDHGAVPEGMDWKDRKSQILRFEIIKEVGIESGSSILDVGCGYGAFYEFLKEQDIHVDYTGIDLVEDMIIHAQEKYREVRFVVADIRHFNPGREYDYVVASGPFNVKGDVENERWWNDFVKTSLFKMFRLARKAIVFNIMTPYVDYTYSRLFYPDISLLTDFIVKELSRYFILRHDYELYEMTFYVFKRGGSWVKKSL